MNTQSFTSINTKLSFNVVIADHRLDIIFNDAPDAQMFTVKDAWESRQYGNVLTHIINVAKPHYVVMEAGLLLHRTFTDAAATFEDKNVGYVLGSKLAELVNAGQIKHSKDISSSDVYKITWDGFDFLASMMPWTEYQEGEPVYVGQNRNATHLVKKLSQLFRAQDLKMNIRLLFTDRTDGYLQLKKAQWDLFTAGEYSELAEMISADITERATYNTMKRYEAVAEKAKADGGEFVAKMGTFELRDFDNNVIDPADLIGKSVQLASGNVILSKVYFVTEETLPVFMASVKKNVLKVVVLNNVNELLPIEE